MDTIPKYLVFLLAGGMGLVVFREAVAFVKWSIRAIAKLSGKSNPSPAITVSQGNVEQKVNVEQGRENPGDIKYEILEKIFDCTTDTNKAVGELAVEVATMKTQVSFMAKAQGDQNGDIKDMKKSLTSMKEECTKRLLSCERRFSGLHEKIVEEIK